MPRGGKVSVSDFKGNLRLVWSWGGKRYYLHTGMRDSELGRLSCEQLAKKIEGDCITNNFDPTLRKYKNEEDPANLLTVESLFQQFIEWKQQHLYKRTLEKYRGLQKFVLSFFKQKLASAVKEVDALSFRTYLQDQGLRDITVKERIGLMSAAWDWALKKELVKENPWVDLRVTVSPKKKPKPYTREEISKIIEAFQSSPYYSFYVDYVVFAFSTGARTGEIIGLRWKNITEDCSQIWIGESYSRGVLKSTKTNRARTLKPNPEIQEMLLRRRSQVEAMTDNSLVFPSPAGSYIDDHNFRNRAWKKSIDAAGVRFQKPYITRHTFVSHALASGMNPVEVAELTGHNVNVLYRDYAGSIEASPKLPSLNLHV